MCCCCCAVCVRGLVFSRTRLITSDIVGPGFPPRRFPKYFGAAVSAAASASPFVLPIEMLSEKRKKKKRRFIVVSGVGNRKTSTRFIDPWARQMVNQVLASLLKWNHFHPFIQTQHQLTIFFLKYVIWTYWTNFPLSAPVFSFLRN